MSTALTVQNYAGEPMLHTVQVYRKFYDDTTILPMFYNIPTCAHNLHTLFLFENYRLSRLQLRAESRCPSLLAKEIRWKTWLWAAEVFVKLCFFGAGLFGFSFLVFVFFGGGILVFKYGGSTKQEKCKGQDISILCFFIPGSRRRRTLPVIMSQKHKWGLMHLFLR